MLSQNEKKADFAEGGDFVLDNLPSIGWPLYQLDYEQLVSLPKVV